MRVKVCFKCHEFIPIVESSFLNKKEVEKFDKLHLGHPVQKINKEEQVNMVDWKKNLNPEVHSIKSTKQRL